MLDKWLIALDLDGTLFHTNQQISERTISVLHSVTSLGHRIVINTGRSSFSALPRLRHIPADSTLLCSNGAYEYDRKTQKVVWAKMMAAATSLELQRTIQDTLPEASFGWESASGLSYEQTFIREAGGAHTLEQGGAEQPLGRLDIFKMFVRTPGQTGADLTTTLRKLLGGDVEVSSSGVPFVEITATGTNKGTALAKIASKLGFDSDHSIAFGDNLNDVSMLQWAGESVAMGNAIPELLSIASARAECNTEDGVAKFLEARFLGGISAPHMTV